ncbi:MAG: PASTA domain-containing protein [Bacteroidales bacterium]|nr:PASTA domain-containing protein [Bacteroidales bacterium]
MDSKISVMEESKIKKILTGKVVRYLAAAIAIFIVVILLSKTFLSCITKHGQELTVPDFTNITVSEAVSIAEEAGLRVEIGDSVYIRRLGRGLVYSQLPPAGGKVKKGRRIILTINAVSPKKVSMPNLVGFSLRQAKAELSSRGLALGRLTYVEDIATNNVIRQFYGGREIEQGKSIKSLSRIDLELGLNPEENATVIPDVIGLKYLRAVDVMHDNSLNVRKLVFDRSVKDYADSLDAVVYKQMPSPTRELESVDMGTDVTLYLKKEAPKE